MGIRELKFITSYKLVFCPYTSIPYTLFPYTSRKLYAQHNKHYYSDRENFTIKF